MLRRFSASTAASVVVLALLTNSTAVAQEDGADEVDPVEIVYYGDAELIETLRTYDLLDEWIDASPVSPHASLLLVTGNSRYTAQRQLFLNSVKAWATRTERVRTELARIDAAQANSDRLRSIVAQVRDALVLDDRLASDSKTLVAIEDAIGQLAAVQIPEHPPEQSEDPLTVAEVQLTELRVLTETEVVALNGSEPAVASSGPGAFLGFEQLQSGLDSVDQLIKRGRDLIRPAREESERLVSSALAQIPNLHAARMLGSSDVDGLSVVTVDAYIRAATRSSCSVDWALLAGIGRIESNHGRLGGASVSGSGQVSTTIFGPLLDGGETDREGARQRDDEARWAAQAVEATQRATQAIFEMTSSLLRRFSGGRTSDLADLADPDEETDTTNLGGEPGDLGNGFAVVVDSDDGRLDGNAEWDRAIGPMQFLPETWMKWATDGNGDGVADPHNLYDAAAAASDFLCDLSATRGASPSTFVLGYNSSRSYVRSVLSTAQRLRSTSLPDV